LKIKKCEHTHTYATAPMCSLVTINWFQHDDLTNKLTDSIVVLTLCTECRTFDSTYIIKRRS